MPPTFQDREQAFEAKFAHDEAFRFRAAARRDKLFARWAAVTLGLSHEAGETLVKAVLAIPDGSGHDEAVLRHIAGLLRAQDASVSDTTLSATLDRSLQQALHQLAQTPPDQPDMQS